MKKSQNVIVIIAIGVIIIVGIGALLRHSYNGGNTDTDSGNSGGGGNKWGNMDEELAACGLSESEGETILIMQGTVGRINTLSIGLVSVQDDKATIDCWDREEDVSGPPITLGMCESVDFGRYTIHAIGIEDRYDNPFGPPGSGSDSIDILVEER